MLVVCLLTTVSIGTNIGQRKYIFEMIMNVL